MSEYEVLIKPVGKVLRAYGESRARVSIIRGAVGSGKTIQSCIKLLQLMCDQEPNDLGIRPTRFIAIRNTYKELFNTTIKDWNGLWGELGTFKQGGMSPPTWSCDFDLEDGTTVQAELVFIALNRPDADKQLRGTQVTGFWINETKEINKAIFDMADNRHGRYPSDAVGQVKPSWHGIIGDTNSPDEDHWLYQLMEERKPMGWEFFHQAGGLLRDGNKKDQYGQQIWKENKNAENLSNLPDGYYIKAAEGKDEDYIAVNLGNEYGAVITGKPVYPEYYDSTHCKEFEVDYSLPIGLGWDFGLTPSLIFVQITPRGQLRIIDELIADGMDIKQFARDIALPHISSVYGGSDVIGLSLADPAGNNRHETGNTAINILNDLTCDDKEQFTPLNAGFTTEASPSQVPEVRQRAVREYLTKMVEGQPALLVHPRCKQIRKGFRGGYKYRRMQVVGDAKYTDKPDKNEYSHPHDALQYIAVGTSRGMCTYEYKGRDEEVSSEELLNASMDYY